MENQGINHNLLREVNRLAVQSRFIGVVSVLVAVLALTVLWGKDVVEPLSSAGGAGKPSPEGNGNYIRHVSEFLPEDFPDTEEGRLAAFGRQIITETAKYLGPGNSFGEAYSGNHLSCSSCHLNGGTKAYAAPYIGLSGIYPMFSNRDGRVASLEDRINGCFERSMNGRRMPVDRREMVAIVSYMKHLSRNVKIGSRIEGQRFTDLKLPDRKADLAKGERVFQVHCVSCHGQDGHGQWNNAQQTSEGYLYPPLWGDDSFNDGAGMGRMITAAKFIKGNMPLGVTAENPILTDEEAYDVAAYINSFGRPEKANKERDYPDLAKKPKDSAYPPFADDISAEQHKYGPFSF